MITKRGKQVRAVAILLSVWGVWWLTGHIWWVGDHYCWGDMIECYWEGK